MVPAQSPLKVLVSPELAEDGNPDPASAGQLLSLGGTLIADRGAYAVWDVPASARSMVRELKATTIRDDFNSISLARRVIRTGGARNRSGGPASALSPSSGFKFVQLTAPPLEGDLEAIRATGAEIVHYVPENAYLVWVNTPTKASTLKSATEADSRSQFGADYAPSDALSPDLDDATLLDQAVTVSVRLHRPGAWTDADGDFPCLSDAG